MSALTGTGKLVRLILRRDRMLLPLWMLVMCYAPVALVPGIEGIYPSHESRLQAADMINASPAFTAMLGPVYDPSVGGLVAWRGSMIVLLFGVICGLVVIRHTRTEEEAGRRELVGSTVVGRHAGLAAALTVIVVACLVIGGLMYGGLLAQDMNATGSLALAIQYAASGILFGCLGGVAAQLTQGAPAARAVLFVVVGVAYLLRMASDLNPDLDWLMWATPAGWLQRLEPFAGNNWHVLYYAGAGVAVLIGLSFWLLAHRDVDAGVFPPRLGRATAGGGLRDTFALATRLQRGALTGWVIGYAVLGMTLGSMGSGIKEMMKSSQVMQQIVARMGGTTELNNAFLAGMLGLMGLGVAGYSLQAALKPRTEETAQRVEQILATNTSRLRWYASHLVFAFGGSALVAGVGGLVFAVTFGAVTGDMAAHFGGIVRGALIQLPAAWVLTGLAVLLFGVAPRLLGLVWAGLAVCVLFGQIGEAMDLPERALDISPFTHLPKVPGDDIAAQPLLWLAAIVVAAVAVGLTGFGRRDLRN